MISLLRVNGAQGLRSMHDPLTREVLLHVPCPKPLPSLHMQSCQSVGGRAYHNFASTKPLVKPVYSVAWLERVTFPFIPVINGTSPRFNSLHRHGCPSTPYMELGAGPDMYGAVSRPLLGWMASSILSMDIIEGQDEHHQYTRGNFGRMKK